MELRQLRTRRKEIGFVIGFSHVLPFHTIFRIENIAKTPLPETRMVHPGNRKSITI